MNSNFAALQAEWPGIAKEARLAELYARKDPRSSLLYARRSVEALLAWLYDADDSLALPYKSDLNALMSEPTFKRLAGDTIVSKFHLIRKVANSAIHTNAAITVQHSEQTIRELFHVCIWLALRYTREPANRPASTVAFNGEFLSPPPKAGAPTPAQMPRTADQTAKLAEELAAKDTALTAQRLDNVQLQAQLEALRAEVARAKEENKKLPDSHNYTEAETRVYIDLYLGEAGWALDKAEDREFEVHHMPTHAGPTTGTGFVDYVLWGSDGKPLAVVEAKRSSKSPYEGQQQGKLYADALETETGQRPVIYYSNGYEHWIWDDASGYPPRPVQGFHTRDQLQLMVDRRTTRKKLATAAINTEIAGRSYQQAAIRAVADALETDKERKALLVMATGSGKTRTVVALSSLLMQANWAKRVLFLADRVALVDQAARTFKTNLPGSSPVVLGRDVEADSRIHIATYPTMMNLINERTDDGSVLTQRFGIGHYDLIIIDEAHRSVYQKYRAIFDYFDAYLVGLTATPQSEVDRNTYSLFDIEDHVPTFAYELTQAISDGYLVPPRAVPIPLKFPVEGIRYDELSEEDKEAWDSAEWDEDGEIPDAVDPVILNTWLFNANTVDKALEVLMTRGHKVAGGDRIGKTIVFAKNQKHAEFIAERFNINHPQYGGTFAKVITHSVNYVSTLIDAFARTEDSPHIAVSVDMLDTGIDVPEVVNLLFFKVVRSKTKFWQMVGRGTRLRPELYGPGEDKQDFFIFDVCQNIEYFNAELPGSEGSLGQSLAHRSFAVRAQLLAEARTAGLDGDFVPTLQSGLVGQVAGLPRENFLVRPRLEWVEKYSDPASWGTLGTQDLTDLQTKLAPLATLASAADTEEAKRFDLLMYQAQLASLTSAAAVEPYRKKIVEIASALQDQSNIPAIGAQMVLIQSILEGGEWGRVSPQWLELIRVRLRGLVHLIEKKRRKAVYSNFEDTLGDIVEGELKGTVTGSVDLARYREKARVYLQGFLDHMAIHRLRRGLPLTETDLAELQRMLIESGAGSPEELEAATAQAEGLGLFVRSLVGMDRQAALDSLSEFVGEKTLNANQLHFVNMIVQQLTENGVMDVGALYESPYTDAAPAGPESLFPDADVDLLAEALKRVRGSAMVG
ncbi:DEAD/DEAH box helicase family protein [Arthrobacter sp. MI7-26]|uniref:DEAD/DEAH box helicase family protein n=1 Tax=Arthrobacter sp. MI7-26 TaxID=2993653 RepID=UPI002248D672|nr:DEAD/DEAH box helicase family protein [Arthrobacter sp. MI7-26]MCX2749933.1 DEAD/DEAH box helicase family protein [Arthrobacter sp. MI7-26]